MNADEEVGKGCVGKGGRGRKLKKLEIDRKSKRCGEEHGWEVKKNRAQESIVKPEEKSTLLRNAARQSEKLGKHQRQEINLGGRTRTGEKRIKLRRIKRSPPS